MKRIVVFDNGTTETSVETIRQCTKAHPESSVAFIATDERASLMEEAELFSLDKFSLHEAAIHAVASFDGDDKVVFILGDQSLDAEELTLALNNIAASNAGIDLCDIRINGEIIALDELSADSVVREVSLCTT